MRRTHHVYAVELSPEVLSEAAFVRANPQYRAGLPCVYIGRTAHDPDLRFDQHMAGVRSNRFVRRHGLRLAMEWVAARNPMTRADSQYIEVDTAIRLRALGWGVWQA